jgi:sarcosine oxidase subunit beta
MENASVVIIGGGLIGASVAYHLASQGEQDIILLERLDLASAASCQAAGLMFQISSKPAIDELTRTTFKTINTLEEQLGECLDFKRVGTLRLAETEKNRTAVNAVFSVHPVIAYPDT